MIGQGKFPPFDRGALAYYDMLEPVTAVLPRDRAGSLDLQPAVGLAIPEVIDGPIGPARAYAGAEGLQAPTGTETDFLASMAVSALLRLDSSVAGVEGTVISNQSADGIRRSWGVALQSLGGAEVSARLTYTSAEVPATVAATVGVDSDWHLWTFARVRTTDGLTWRVWIDDVLAAEVTAADAIADATGGGLLTVGYRLDNTATPAAFLVADLGALQLYDRELAHEEVQLLYRSLVDDVATAHTLVQALEPVHVDGGGVWSTREDAWVRREIRVDSDVWAGQIGQLRAVRDELPDRCYGTALTRWETVLGVGGDGAIEERRARVLTAIRRVTDFTEAEYQETFAPVLDTEPENIQLLQYSNVYRYTAAELVAQPDPWVHVTGSSLSGNITYPGYLRLDNPSGLARDWPSNPLGIRWHVSWSNGLAPFEYRVRVCDWTTGVDVYQGLMVSDSAGRAVFFGRKHTDLIYDVWDGSSWAGDTVLGPNPINNDVLTLTGLEDGTISGAKDADFTTLTDVGTLAAAGFLTPPLQVWILGFTKGVGVWPAGPLAFLCADDVRAVWRRGLEPYFATMYRDPLLPGSPDYRSADRQFQARKPLQMTVHASAADALYCDDPNALVGFAPLV